MDKERDIERREESASVDAGTSGSRRHAFVWVALALAVLAWLVLVWSNGYVALVLGVLACTAGFWGASDSEKAMKRLAIAAIIAAMVLVVVLAAFLIVIKIGLG
ncbi:MAG: hypothetical protein K2I54_00775 [Muribaculaceae bacterium]|nr:hypothetical protein [Muribaculaceae bacterium]